MADRPEGEINVQNVTDGMKYLNYVFQLILALSYEREKLYFIYYAKIGGWNLSRNRTANPTFVIGELKINFLISFYHKN